MNKSSTIIHKRFTKSAHDIIGYIRMYVDCFSTRKYFVFIPRCIRSRYTRKKHDIFVGCFGSGLGGWGWRAHDADFHCKLKSRSISIVPWIKPTLSFSCVFLFVSIYSASLLACFQMNWTWGMNQSLFLCHLFSFSAHIISSISITYSISYITYISNSS